MLTRRQSLQTLGLVAMADQACAQNSSPPHFDVTWVGGPTMVITFGDLTILTDPVLGETFAMGDPNDAADHQTVRMHRRLTPVAGLDLEAVDLLLLSHVHPDHFDEQAWTALDRELPVILPVADVDTVGARGFRKLDGLNWGETRQLESGPRSVSITAVAAYHSRDTAMAKALGFGNGYWLEFREGAWKRAMYWTGDSMPTDDVVAAVRSHGKPDLMVPHVGGVGVGGPLGQITMGAADVVAFAAAVEAKCILPIHHSTYAFYREPIDDLAKRGRGEPYRLDLVAAGSKVTYA